MDWRVDRGCDLVAASGDLWNLERNARAIVDMDTGHHTAQSLDI